MRIAVMGTGSIGGYFGGTLAQYGHDVTLIARGANLTAIREKGLQLITDNESKVIPCPAEQDPTRVGVVDLILLTVKTYHNAIAVPMLGPMVGDNTVVICLQNGIDSYQLAADVLGSAKVMPGAAYIEANLIEPGVVQQNGDVVRIEFGEDDGARSDRGVVIEEMFNGSGVRANFSDDIHRTLWTKFLFIATMAGITSLARESMAVLMARPEWVKIIQSCMEEIESVGSANNINLSDTIVDDTLAYIRANLKDMHASMYTDLMAQRPLELESLTGAVVRAGIKGNITTPINDLIYAMLKPYAKGA
tara:strand:+ start:3638 stop:4552 length:915 start_codon:yes stop_codon:yes gene_type:complete